MTGLVDTFLTKRVFSWLIIVLTLAGGYFSYNNLGRYEDPAFVIRTAIIYVPYPGASPSEVADEVTDLIEETIQQLPELDEVSSASKVGRAEVHVDILRRFSPTQNELNQVWTKMRNKLKDVERKLPPGAGPIIVNDDFGDVFSLFYGVTGEGYTFKELKDYVDGLRKEILLVPGVARVTLQGVHQEQIAIEIPRALAAQLGITPNEIYATLNQQNQISASGSIHVGTEYIEIRPTGNISSLDSISNLLIAGRDKNVQIRLGDIAQIRRIYQEPPSDIFRFNGVPAIGLGVSNITGGNVVDMGDAVKARLAELDAERPVGIELHPISIQSDSVRESVNNFVANLVAAIVIVVVVLLLFMGLRSGLIIGFVLLLTVAGTLIAMYLNGIDMQRISLGALIIALGMLVDNAIVVTDGILTGTQRGQSAGDAAKEIVKATVWPLLGGTLVGILAFSPIGFSPDNTGEYAGSLFWVILYSMLLSWFFAITVTPFLCATFLKVKTPDGDLAAEAPEGRFLSAYRSLLTGLLRFRWPAVAVLILLLWGAFLGFGFVPVGFFPDSTRAQFVLDYWTPQGTDIRDVSEDLADIEPAVREIEGVTNVTTVVGQGAMRFMLTYSPEQPNPAYGTLLIDVEDYRQIPQIMEQVSTYVDANFPQAQAKAWKFALGPGGGPKVEAEFKGPDTEVLRRLCDEAKGIMFADGGAIGIRDDWRNKVKVIRPVFSESLARSVGISIEDLRSALATVFGGRQVGIYREGDDLIPIIARAPEEERTLVESIRDVQVFSPLTGKMVPMAQFVTNLRTDFDDGILRRENRFLMIKAQCDPAPGVITSELQKRLMEKIEAMELPPGYSLSWGGEYGNSLDAKAGLASTIPFGFAAMVVTVILLFNAIRQPLVIWLTVPLAIIGVTVGLILFNAPFEFMAILGFLSLVGMLIKNAIVLVDQINVEIASGKDRFLAVLDSGVSRVRPVSMGAITTVLGVAPLLSDSFFRSMAVVIMFGLTFATILTLLIVPVIYAILFRIYPAAAPQKSPS